MLLVESTPHEITDQDFQPNPFSVLDMDRCDVTYAGCAGIRYSGLSVSLIWTDVM